MARNEPSYFDAIELKKPSSPKHASKDAFLSLVSRNKLRLVVGLLFLISLVTYSVCDSNRLAIVLMSIL